MRQQACTTVVRALALSGLLALPVGALAQGGIFVTGHDADWHAQFQTGPQHIVQKSIGFVTNNKVNPKILFVSDERYIGSDSMDTRPGIVASGFPTFDFADDGTAGGSVLNVGTVNFKNYDCVIVASSGGGLLHQSELDLLNARASDMVDFINGGGGLVAFAESFEYDAMLGATTHDLYGFLPFVVSANSLPQGENTFQVTPFGASIGLVDSDVNSAFAHNTFATTGGMNVVDRDGFGQGNIISLAYYGRIGLQGPTGVPEPGAMALLGAAGIGLAGAAIRRRK